MFTANHLSAKSSVAIEPLPAKKTKKAAVPPAGGAAWKSVDQVTAKMVEAEKTVQSLNFHYVQAIHIEATGEDTQAEGQASFLRPKKFRVEQTAPQAQVIVSDGNKIWMYSQANQQVIVQNASDLYSMAGAPQGLAPFQTPVEDYKSQFNMSLEKVNRPGAPPEPALKLVPKSQDEAVPYTVYLWVDSGSGLPYRTELAAGSVRVTTSIGQIKVNPTFSDADFIFTAPKGAQIMEVPFERSQK